MLLLVCLFVCVFVCLLVCVCVVCWCLIVVVIFMFVFSWRCLENGVMSLLGEQRQTDIQRERERENRQTER